MFEIIPCNYHLPLPLFLLLPHHLRIHPALLHPLWPWHSSSSWLFLLSPPLHRLLHPPLPRHYLLPHLTERATHPPLRSLRQVWRSQLLLVAPMAKLPLALIATNS